MKNVLQFLSFTTLAAGVALPAPRALYFLENNPAGANIVSLKVSSKDGSLSDPARVPTGGNGLVGVGNTGAAVAMGKLSNHGEKDTMTNKSQTPFSVKTPW